MMLNRLGFKLCNLNDLCLNPSHCPFHSWALLPWDSLRAFNAMSVILVPLGHWYQTIVEHTNIIYYLLNQIKTNRGLPYYY